MNEPKTPTQLKEEGDFHFNAVSRALIELEGRGFVKCLTPNEKLGRFYEITPKGKKVLEKFKK
jgi:predicted transcriptional regulator